MGLLTFNSLDTNFQMSGNELKRSGAVWLCTSLHLPGVRGTFLLSSSKASLWGYREKGEEEEGVGKLCGLSQQ